MAFTVGDFQDLVRLLDGQPEWRAALRRQVLSDELLQLPDLVRSLAQMQGRTDEQLATLTERLTTLTQRVDSLAEQVSALTQRLDTLTQRVDELTQRLDVLTQRVDDLTQRLDVLTQRVDDLTQRLDALTQRVDALTLRVDALTVQVGYLVGRVGEMDGELMELRFARRAPAYLSRFARRLRVVDPSRLADLLDDAVEAGQLTEEEREAALLADVVAIGRRRADGAEAYFVAEVSSGVGVSDVRRVLDRSRILAKLGQPVVPLVAGRWINGDAEQYARSSGVEPILVPRKPAPPIGEPPPA